MTPFDDHRPASDGELPERPRQHRRRFTDVTPEHLRNEAQLYRAMAADAPMGWIQQEFSRIAKGLSRIAEAKMAAERSCHRRAMELAPEQLRGLARAYRDLGSHATTDWTQKSFDRIAAELERRAAADE